MVAVILVVLSHLFHWPRGGFVGVDVFFVISGFLITGSLMHTLEKTGRISFSSFYRRRIRRIVPAATLVLLVTCVAAYLIFTASRVKSTLLDALAAFLFVSNWRYGIEGTDYFNASGPVSPLQHYWSLSVEEQFYFVWPAVIFLVGLVAAHKARRQLAAGVMGVVVLGSFAYSVLDTASNPTWAYFSTLTRVWELGVGALLAITITYFERIPNAVRPALAWAGLVAIAVGAFAITETGGGFPAPWAAVPVLGAAAIIASGVSGEHRGLGVLTNRVSTYVGDISYSLYLWHWPVIILLTSLMDRSSYYFATALFLMFGLSIAAYHLFENPIRASKWLETTAEKHDRSVLDLSRWRLRTLKMSEANQSIGIGALALITAGLVAYAVAPVAVSTAPPAVAAKLRPDDATLAAVGPAQAKLTEEIVSAVQATSWPDLSPTMDEAIDSKQAPPEILRCGLVQRPGPESCTWGSPTAKRTMVILGDSIAMTYVETLKNFAEGSGGEWKVRSEAMFGCTFIDGKGSQAEGAIAEACPARREEAIKVVNDIKPDVVVISNIYSARDAAELTTGLSSSISRISASGARIALLAAPPSDIKIGDCYNRMSKPADCISRVTSSWSARAATERGVAESAGAVFLDSSAWFCTLDGYCPSFVGTTPVKIDNAHMTPEYAKMISPAVGEAIRSSELLAPK
ncbi:putative acyltransferase [Rhodococcus opacus]|uniref:Putative acyltransferase n=2 Tax=Rhodococcus opacus TaxID=37919 RepID=A0A1B1K1G6_RHOOP|nr:putative acyltransferase [Rhodococcus opacus]